MPFQEGGGEKLTAHGGLETVPLEALDEGLFGLLGGIWPPLDVETLAPVLQRLAHAVLSTECRFPHLGIVCNVEEDIGIVIQHLRTLYEHMVSNATGLNLWFRSQQLLRTKEIAGTTHRLFRDASHAVM